MEIRTRLGRVLFVACQRKFTWDNYVVEIYDFYGRLVIELNGSLNDGVVPTVIQ